MTRRRTVPAGTLPELFGARAAAAPDAVAVVCGDGVLSYAELDARAGRLAGVLARLGAGPESVVAVLLERSAELVVALLAVLKAGAAYLPVDPGYPARADRVHARRRGPGGDRGRDADGGPGAGRGGRCRCWTCGLAGAGARGRLLSGPLAAHPAYVIYTSGSTGVPKGVVVTHAGVAELLAGRGGGWVVGGAGVRVLQFAFGGV